MKNVTAVLLLSYLLLVLSIGGFIISTLLMLMSVIEISFFVILGYSAALYVAGTALTNLGIKMGLRTIEEDQKEDMERYFRARSL